MREVTEKCGTIKKYAGNIYLHYIRKCLYNQDSEFCFGVVNAPERTKQKTTAAWKTELKQHSIKFPQSKIYVEKVQYYVVGSFNKFFSSIF